MNKRFYTYCCLILLFFSQQVIFGQTSDSLDRKEVLKNFSISGIIKDGSTGETLPYASFAIEGSTVGVLSNQYGFYSLTFKEGNFIILCRYLGYEEFRKEINLTQNTRIDIELFPKTEKLQEVIVTVSKNNLKNVEQRMSKIDSKTVKQLPSLFGEADIIRCLNFMPGINSVAETGGSFSVRGGGFDQNLMLLDEATVYNANHLIGLYSTFNPNIVKDVKFYKSGIPASYGGRASSVMEVTQKEGNMKSFEVKGGIGLIASNLSVEGPLIKDKCSFIIGARRSYVDMFFKFIPNDEIDGVKTYFYDLNSKVNYIINTNNRIYLSFYSGKDATDLESYNSEYGNITASLRFNHIYNSKLFSNTTLIYSKYKMTDGGNDDIGGWKNHIGLDHYEFKNAFTFYTKNHNIELGVKAIYYTFHMGELEPKGDSSKTLRIKLPEEHAFESSVYISDNFQVSPRIELQYGLRFSNYNFLGPLDVYKYDENEPKDPSTIIDTITYKKNKVIQSNNNIEPRVSLKYSISETQFIKLSYNKIYQYIQQVSNTIIPLPYQMWKPSNNYIKPLSSDQYSVGYFLDILNNTVELSFECYYKSLKNIIEVKPGTDISLNKTIETGLLQGKGRAYGLEIMASKVQGKLKGMVSYSWSRSEKKIDGTYSEERINDGKYYSSDYDIPNKLTISCEYKLSSRVSLTSDFIYQTGRPITYPSGQYSYFNTLIPYYSDKNMDRIPDFHRLDVGMVVKNKKKEDRKWEGYWVFSLYNLYARKNAYSIYMKRIQGTQNYEAIKFWAMGLVPSISYNVKF